MRLTYGLDEVEHQNKEEQQRIRMEYLQGEIYNEEQIINKLEMNLAKLNVAVKRDVIMLLISVGILLYIATHAVMILLRLVETTSIAIVIFAAMVSFMANTIRLSIKDIPVYIRCRKEEKGTSTNDANYVYQIKRHKRQKKELEQELQALKESE